MNTPPASSGIDLPSPTLSARVREVGDFLAAPLTGRLTEEQRALALGIARRLVIDVSGRLGGVDSTALWQDWLRGGLPGAARLAAACFGRGEEHRWREFSLPYSGAPDERAAGPAGDDASPSLDNPQSDADRAYLALCIADRRRFDGFGQPCLAIADLDVDLLRALALDIAAWGIARSDHAAAVAERLGAAARQVAGCAGESGIDVAATAYHRALMADAAVSEAAEAAIARHDWMALIALAAAARKLPYADVALELVGAEAAALPLLLAPLGLDRAAFGPIEASLVTLPARSIAVGGLSDGDYSFPVMGESAATDGEAAR